MTPAELEAKLATIIETQHQNSAKLDKLCIIMTGNGDPSRGIVVRFDRVEQWWIEHTKKKTKIALAVLACGLSFFGSLALLVLRLLWGV